MTPPQKCISVVFIVGALPYGGIEIGLLDLLCTLDAQRFNAKVINLSGQGLLGPRYVEAGIAVINMGFRLSTHRLDNTWRLHRLLKRLDPAVIVTAQFSANYHARLAAFGLRAKVITYAQNTKSERYQVRKLADRCLGRMRTDRFIAASQAVQAVLKQCVPASRTKTQVLYNAVSPARLQLPAGYTRADFRQREGVAHGAFLIVAMGRCVYQKGFDLLLTAFADVHAEISEALLFIAGDGGLLPDLARMVERLQLQGCVRLLGYRADTAALLHASDLFVLPSRWEGFGIVALEAMAMGIPMVLTETCPVTEFLAHGETAWIVSCGPRGMAEGIVTLYRHATLRQKMACQAAALFQRDFTMDGYVQKMGQVIESVVPS